MVKSLIGPSSSSGAPLRAYLEPVLRHSVWFGFFLVLAPIVGPRGYGVFILALCGIAIAEALLAKTGSQALIDLPVIDKLHVSDRIKPNVGDTIRHEPPPVHEGRHRAPGVTLVTCIL